MQKAYAKINWENYPSEETPINERNLNKIDAAMDEVDNRVIAMDTTKLDKAAAASMVKDITFNEKTGIFTVTYLNGATATLDTKLEKLAINWSYNKDTQQLVITLDDGTTQTVDLSALITQYEFMDTDTIAFSVGTNGEVSANVKSGSITEDKIEPNYLANVKVEVAKAEAGARAAESSAIEAKSYTHGGTGTRENEDVDNAKYYYEQTKQVSQSLNGIIPQGTVAFANLPASGMEYGHMYNVSDAFVSDERFNDGGGIYYGPGNNVIWISGDLWDVTAGSSVTGVKGANQSTYSQGNVSLSASDVGAVATGGDTANNTVAFTSGDNASPTAWTDVALLKSGEKHSSILAKVSNMFKNIRWLYKVLGTADISAIGDGTVRGAIATQNSNLANNAQAISNISESNAMHSNQIATLSQTTQNHEAVIGNIQSTLSVHTNAINDTKSYFFGGTTYATYQDKNLLTKGITLPEPFNNCDTNNYFVSVTMINDYVTEQVYPRVSKANGTFMVYFRSVEGSWNSGSALWFDYSVIIAH